MSVATAQTSANKRKQRTQSEIAPVLSSAPCTRPAPDPAERSHLRPPVKPSGPAPGQEGGQPGVAT
jgi:hypothetical protein